MNFRFQPYNKIRVAYDPGHHSAGGDTTHVLPPEPEDEQNSNPLSISTITINGITYKISDSYTQELLKEINNLKTRVTALENK